MGEWTVHLDAPEGTSLEGTEELAFRVLKELQGIEASPQISRSSIRRQRRGRRRRRGDPFSLPVQALPPEERTRTQAQMIAEMRQRLRKFSGDPAEHHRRATRSAAAKGRAASRSPPTSSAPT